mmetsp:Transcript_26196/g.36898  ORF Transcript_26196/g.36898 Transcript_26196/m.36898 type:complete len:210 (-) Transcript_26196:673-1302(-)
MVVSFPPSEKTTNVICTFRNTLRSLFAAPCFGLVGGCRLVACGLCIVGANCGAGAGGRRIRLRQGSLDGQLELPVVIDRTGGLHSLPALLQGFLEVCFLLFSLLASASVIKLLLGIFSCVVLNLPFHFIAIKGGVHLLLSLALLGLSWICLIVGSRLLQVAAASEVVRIIPVLCCADQTVHHLLSNFSLIHNGGRIIPQLLRYLILDHV